MTRIIIEVDEREASAPTIEKKPCRGCGGATGPAEALAIAQASGATDAGAASAEASASGITYAPRSGALEQAVALHGIDAGRAPGDEHHSEGPSASRRK